MWTCSLHDFFLCFLKQLPYLDAPWVASDHLEILSLARQPTDSFDGFINMSGLEGIEFFNMRLKLGQITQFPFLLCMLLLVLEEYNPASTIPKSKMLSSPVILNSGDDVLLLDLFCWPFVSYELSLLVLTTKTTILFHLPSIKLFLKPDRKNTYRSNFINKFQKGDRS